jgi:hypothetical protein
VRYRARPQIWPQTLHRAYRAFRRSSCRCSSFRSRRQSRHRTDTGPRSPATNATPQSTHSRPRGPIRRAALYAATCSVFCSRHRRPARQRHERQRTASPRGTRNESTGRYCRHPPHHFTDAWLPREFLSRKSGQGSPSLAFLDDPLPLRSSPSGAGDRESVRERGISVLTSASPCRLAPASSSALRPRS